MLWSHVPLHSHHIWITCTVTRVLPNASDPLVLWRNVFFSDQMLTLGSFSVSLSLRNPNTKSVLNSFQVLFSFPRKTFWLKIVRKKATSNNTNVSFFGHFVFWQNSSDFEIVRHFCTFPSCMLTCGGWPTFPGIPQSGWILLQMADGGANVVRLLHMFGQSAELICGGLRILPKISDILQRIKSWSGPSHSTSAYCISLITCV